jgi:hypothetical protein
MDAQTEAVTARCRKNLPGLIGRENIFFTKDVAVFGERLFATRGNISLMIETNVRCRRDLYSVGMSCAPETSARNGAAFHHSAA